MKKMLLILTTFVFAVDVDCDIDGASFVDSGDGTVTFDVTCENESAIAGYQFDLLSDGLLTISSVSGDGNLSGAAGFMLSASTTTVIAFSLAGSTIPEGSSGALCNITATYDIVNAGQVVAVYAEEEGPNGNRLLFSGAGGTQLDAYWEDRNWTVGTALSINPHLINKFELSDNYPNPFNPSTNINFSVANYGEVTLVVFDALGREVNKLASGVYAPGNYNVIWNGSDHNGNEMSSGMYFYRLNAGDFTQTKKMLFMK
jgi:hypothetical protein